MLTPTGGRGRILLAEDDEGLRSSYLRQLKRAGYDVEDVEDGASAAWHLRAERFDVLLSDISMPGIDGMELLKLAREADDDLPIVLMTALPTAETAIRALERRVLRYLVKPFRQEELEAVLDEAVRMRRLANVKREAEAIVREHVRQSDLAATLFAAAIDQLWMAYQPIVSWSPRRVYAYEALVRSDAGMKNPAELLHAAESLGRVHELGRVVRRQVATRVAGTENSLLFFVNLHPQDLIDEELYAADAPLSYVANRVVLEITERASLAAIDDLPGRLQRLRALGFRIALDDLGAGYAGLASFLELRPEIVKLDMGLIRDLDRDEAKRKLVSNLISLCAELGCQIVAEGVERQGEREALSKMGCELMQGYYFCKPLRSLGQLDWGREDLALPGVPADRESARLASLRSYDILDSAPEPAFDAIAGAAQAIVGSDIAFIGFVDDRRQWYKAKIGLSVAETPREQTICQHVISGEGAIVVEDLREDARFRDHPAVQELDGPRFYAGFPLRAIDGHVLGTLCVVDRLPRQLSRVARDALAALAHQSIFELELRRRMQAGLDPQASSVGGVSSTSQALRTLVASLSRMMASAETLTREDLVDASERGREMMMTMHSMRNVLGEQLARALAAAG